jgi:2-oxoglutarate ferredoxin oxidoreductase subunit delta
MAKGKVVIDPEMCKGCGLCRGVCSVNIIDMETSALNGSGYLPAKITDADKCIACGNCAVMCPDSAISVYRIDE